MSENKNQSSKIIFDGKHLSLEGGQVNYNTENKPLSLRKALNRVSGGKSYSSLGEALKDVKKVLRKI